MPHSEDHGEKYWFFTAYETEDQSENNTPNKKRIIRKRLAVEKLEQKILKITKVFVTEFSNSVLID